MYTTLAKVQTLLGPWPYTPDQEAKLDEIIASTKEVIDGFLWWDYLEQKQRSERISKCKIYKNYSTIYLEALNATSIDAIDGVAYTWVLWDDYIIEGDNKRKVSFYNFPTWSLNTRFPSFEITYTSWYNPIPEDIVYAQSLLAMSEYAKYQGRPLESYKLRQRTVKFASSDDFETFSNTINRYSTLCVY